MKKIFLTIVTVVFFASPVLAGKTKEGCKITQFENGDIATICKDSDGGIKVFGYGAETVTSRNSGAVTVAKPDGEIVILFPKEK